MAGNVQEWTLDWFTPYQNPCADCAALSSNQMTRVLRGGSWDTDRRAMRASARSYLTPWERSSGIGGNVGARCGRPL